MAAEPGLGLAPRARVGTQIRTGVELRSKGYRHDFGDAGGTILVSAGDRLIWDPSYGITLVLGIGSV